MLRQYEVIENILVAKFLTGREKAKALRMNNGLVMRDLHYKLLFIFTSFAKRLKLKKKVSCKRCKTNSKSLRLYLHFGYAK